MAVRQGTPKEDIKYYELVDTRKILDFDGFWTDYAWYRNARTGKHIFIIGDIDIYPPDEDFADRSCNTYEEARKIFKQEIFML